MFDPDSAALSIVIQGMTRSNSVPTWPADEIEFYRNGEWHDFTDREEQLQQMRAQKVLAALVALEPPNHEVPSRGDHLVLVDVPTVPYGPDGEPDEVDAAYFKSAARNIRFQVEQGNAFAGSNLTEAVALLCEATAEGLLLGVLRRMRGSFFPYSRDECPRVEHGVDPNGAHCYYCGGPL